MADKGFPWLNVEFKNQTPRANVPPLWLWAKCMAIGLVGAFILYVLSLLI